jgi:hypothetical protein
LSAIAPSLASERPVPVVVTGSGGPQILNLVLKVAATQQQLTVTDDAAPTVSTDPAANSNALVLKGDDLAALADDPDDLAADLQALAGPSAGPGGGSIFIDGFSGGDLPPKESIREIRINQNPFSPEYDKLGFGRIEIFTKPGADKYRGTVDYNFADDFWNSRNPYSLTKAPLLLNEFEGGGGGPLGKRASFTLDAQRNTVDNGSIVNAVTLDPATLAIQPYSTIYKTPQRFTRASPRVDYALGENHTLSVRYTFTTADINGSGIGTFDLPSRGYDVKYTHQTAQITETSVFGTAVNETRFQFYRGVNHMTAFDDSPALQVLGAFNGNGSNVGHSADTQNSYEFQNITSMIKGAHSIRFGVRLREQSDDNASPNNFNGTFSFGGGLAPADLTGTGPLVPISSIERYQRTLLLAAQGLSPTQIRALGGGATQFSISAGNPALSVSQFDAGLFAGDYWRIRPNLTLSLGVRYELQTNISDWRDVAPRVAVAWSPGSVKKPGKTVIRAGFGTFYDRFALANTLTAERFNGLVQQQYVVTNPDFFPNVPPLSSLAGSQSTQVIERVASDLRAPYLLQSAFSFERQLPAHITLAVTYSNAHGLHQLRSRDINAPLPGTYQIGVQGSGVFPLGTPGPVMLMESSGVYNQNQLIANMSAKVNGGLSLFGFYVLNQAKSNTDGVGTTIANTYDYHGEYGPASTDVRNRVTFGGSINSRFNIRVSPFVILQSGAPFDITAGQDLYGTTLFNGRPGIATGSDKPGLISTSYGLLDPNPTPGEAQLPRNYGRGPGQFTVNLRLAKTIGFGPLKEGSGGSRAQASGTSGGMAIPGGGSLRNIIGVPSTSRRYNLVISMSVRNLLNHTNEGPITGDITSPLFGRSNRVAGNVNGEGFSENANNRRLELQMRFTF